MNIRQKVEIQTHSHTVGSGRAVRETGWDRVSKREPGETTLVELRTREGTDEIAEDGGD